MTIQDMDYKEAAAELARRAEALGLSIDCAFVPFSQSRNAGEKMPSLNWKVTLKRNGRDIMTTDYMQGCGHCPAHKLSVKEAGGINSIGRADAIAKECETGKTVHPYKIMQSGARIPAPSLADVLFCLCADSDVLNYANFEQWADNFGYDPDSRKGEAIYRQCLEIALSLRAAIGDNELSELCQLAAMM